MRVSSGQFAEIVKKSPNRAIVITVNFTLLYRATLRRSLGNWILGYEVANYALNQTTKLRTLKWTSQLLPDWTSQLHLICRASFVTSLTSGAKFQNTRNVFAFHWIRIISIVLIYKAIYAITPTPFSGLLSLRSTKCNLRGKMKLILPRANTSKYGLGTFRYYGPKMWNSLRDELRTAPTIKNFVSQIRKLTFDTCSCYLCRFLSSRFHTI